MLIFSLPRAIFSRIRQTRPCPGCSAFSGPITPRIVGVTAIAWYAAAVTVPHTLFYVIILALP